VAQRAHRIGEIVVSNLVHRKLPIEEAWGRCKADQRNSSVANDEFAPAMGGGGGSAMTLGYRGSALNTRFGPVLGVVIVAAFGGLPQILPHHFLLQEQARVNP